MNFAWSLVGGMAVLPEEQSMACVQPARRPIFIAQEVIGIGLFV
jgi:hypothetical protein